MKHAMIGRRLKSFSAAVFLAVLSSPASADAIDGNWCHNDGRRFSIRGPEIVTPGGKRLEGNYSRHGFSYLVPSPDVGAGQTVVMTLANENTVYLRYGDTSSSGAPETWLRCSPSISSLQNIRRS